jgi:hypothetical protein
MITFKQLGELSGWLNDTTVSVEQYLQVTDGNSPKYDLCLYSYYFEPKVSTEPTSIKLKVNVFLKPLTDKKWDLYTLDIEYKESRSTCSISAGFDTGINAITYPGFIKNLTDALDKNVEKLFKYVDDNRNIYYEFGRYYRDNWVSQLVDAAGDIGMFIWSDSIQNSASDIENKIKVVTQRRVENLSDSDLDKIEENIRKNKEGEDKKKADPNNTYTKLEPSEIPNTPDVIKLVLSKMEIPKNSLTVKNIELDGAFRISYE